MLMPLNKIADEIGVQESEARRLAIYAGLRRERGCYHDRECLRIYINFLHERLYGFALLDEPLADETPTTRKPAARTRVSSRRKRMSRTPRSGSVLLR
jgi:hypothetical protein